MRLASLELSGFKSFAKKSELVFSTSIVGIVGPNGSGKSNIAEAFRFVLGEQSMKSMRGKRGEDLIFNGSATLGKLGRAGVRLTFDNHDRVLPLDFDEVILERVVYRDGANEYLLNGSQVRLKDILELLSKANIGASGHHIISQGEADRILSASPWERRAMIEDALGLKAFQYKKQESLKKLEKTAENIAQVVAVRKEIGPHLKFLEKQMEKLRRAEGLREELLVEYRQYLKREELYLAREKKVLREEIATPERELKQITERIERLKETMREEEQEFSTGDSKIIATEQQLQETQKNLENLQREDSRLEGILYAEEKARDRALAAQKKGEDVTVPLSSVVEFLEEGEARVRESQTLERTDALRDLLKGLVSTLRGFVERHMHTGKQTENVEGFEREIQSLKEQRQELVKKIGQMHEDRDRLKKEFDSLRGAREQTREAGRHAEKELFELLGKRTELNVNLTTLHSRQETFTRDTTRFEEELREAQALLGLPVLHFSNIDFTDEQGQPVSVEQVEIEARETQEKRRLKVERLKVRLEESGGANMDVATEYAEVKERDAFFAKETEDLERSAQDLKSLIEQIEETLAIQFKEGIEKINDTFDTFFQTMFGGGKAGLVIMKEKPSVHEEEGDDGETNEEDTKELKEGIEVSIALPNKRVRGLQALSGGERALTSIALLFAISQVNPPPFIILDETDAALDESNSKKYGDMIETLSHHSQLILITHNRETMSRAGILYGITMGRDGISKLLSVSFTEAASVAK